MLLMLVLTDFPVAIIFPVERRHSAIHLLAQISVLGHQAFDLSGISFSPRYPIVQRQLSSKAPFAEKMSKAKNDQRPDPDSSRGDGSDYRGYTFHPAPLRRLVLIF